MGSESPQIATPLSDVLTERLALSRFAASDVDALAAVFAEPAVWEFPFGHGMDRDWTQQFVSRAIGHWEQFGFGLWVVRTRVELETIGYLGLSMPSFLSELIPAARMPAVEVGWRLHPGHWGRGYATEGAHAALREAFETLGLSEVCCVPQSPNTASVRVARRVGLEYERTATLAATGERSAVDVDLYWMTRARWLKAGAAGWTGSQWVPESHQFDTEEGITMSVQAEQIDEWIGSEVVDGNDEKLGKVADVYYRGSEAVVVEIRTGLIGRKLSLAALNGATVSMKHLRLGVAQTVETEGGIDPEALNLLAQDDNRLQGIGVEDLESATQRRARLEAADKAVAHADTMEAEARHRAEEAMSLARVAQEAADNAAAAQRASQDAQAEAVAARAEADRLTASGPS